LLQSSEWGLHKQQQHKYSRNQTYQRAFSTCFRATTTLIQIHYDAAEEEEEEEDSRIDNKVARELIPFVALLSRRGLLS